MEIVPPAASALTLYGVLHADKVESCLVQGSVPTRYLTPEKNYIGLRKDAKAAIERYRQIFGENTPKNQLAFLEVHFTAEGVVRFVTESCGPEDLFCSRLSKRTYKDYSVDWGVWHFVGDLPLGNADLLTVSFASVV